MNSVSLFSLVVIDIIYDTQHFHIQIILFRNSLHIRKRENITACRKNAEGRPFDSMCQIYTVLLFIQDIERETRPRVTGQGT